MFIKHMDDNFFIHWLFVDDKLQICLKYVDFKITGGNHMETVIKVVSETDAAAEAPDPIIQNTV
jgi:hypothetical protein